MFKTLLKKQLMETNTWLLVNRKTGKRRKLSGMLLLSAAYLALFAALGVVFFFAAANLCVPLHGQGLDYLFYAIMGLAAIMLGVFGSVFNTYASLYSAKDNDILLSMPIKPIYIICARLSGVWMWSLIYEMIVFVPALLAYTLYIDSSIRAVASGFAVMLIISLFVLTLSCILGYAVAKISAKLKNKGFVTVAVSVIFLIIYYVFYFKANEIFASILNNATELGETVNRIYPLSLMGKAACGDIISLVILFIITAAVLLAVYFVLNRSFLTLAKASRISDGTNEKKRKYFKIKSLESALLFKERKRFTSCPIYMLNCALGALFLPAFGIFLIIKSKTIADIIAETAISRQLVVLAASAVICALSTMIDISAPSVSLEGQNIWIANSLPIPTIKLLTAKLKLHIIIAAPCSLFCSLCTAIAIGCSIAETIILIILPLLYTVFIAAFGLVMNLLYPNLTWKNETVPVKQSLSVNVTLLGGMFFALLIFAPYLLVYNYIPPLVFAAIISAAFMVLIVIMLIWLVSKGVKKFAKL